jgi:hypothetical protein
MKRWISATLCALALTSCADKTPAPSTNPDDHFPQERWNLTEDIKPIAGFDGVSCEGAEPYRSACVRQGDYKRWACEPNEDGALVPVASDCREQDTLLNDRYVCVVTVTGAGMCDSLANASTKRGGIEPGSDIWKEAQEYGAIPEHKTWKDKIRSSDRKQCKKGKRCGSSCIAWDKTCHK